MTELKEKRNKSVADVNDEAMVKHKTSKNKHRHFPIGTRVMVVCHCQDFYFFRGNELGTVIRNGGNYLSIIVEFDKPRHFENGHIQKSFNFEPQDLLKLPKRKSKMKVNTTVITEVTLAMNEEEIEWLRGLMQNPLHGLTPDEENKDDKRMRKLFWDALN